jgi:pimeloyl-ACP methyl ester carboxylesterase
VNETQTVDERANQLFELFLTPQARDTSPKALRMLGGARRVTISHRQILEWPAINRPPITLAGFVWDGAPDVAKDAPTVLLVHGWELQAGRMGAFVLPLLAAGFRVAALDMPAHGQSEGGQATMLDWAEAIKNAVQQMGKVKAVIAHSFGGMSAAWLLAHEPNLGVEKLVLMASGSDVEFLIRNSPYAQSASSEQMQAMREAFRRRVGRWPAKFDAAQAAANLKIPALVVHDVRDPIVPFAHGEAYARAIPNARLLATSGLGHTAILRDRDVVAAVATFLAARDRIA